MQLGCALEKSNRRCNIRLQAMLHRQTEQIPPMMPSSSSAPAQPAPMSSGPGPGPIQASQAPLPSSMVCTTTLHLSFVISICVLIHLTYLTVRFSQLLTQFIIKRWYSVHFIYLFVYLVKSYRSLIALILPVIFTYFVIFFTQMFLLKTFKALNGLLCADVPLRNYSLTHSLTHSLIVAYQLFLPILLSSLHSCFCSKR